MKNELYYLLNEMLCGGKITHEQLLTTVKEMIDDTIDAKIALNVSDDDVQSLVDCVDALDKACSTVIDRPIGAPVTK